MRLAVKLFWFCFCGICKLSLHVNLVYRLKMKFGTVSSWKGKNKLSLAFWPNYLPDDLRKRSRIDCCRNCAVGDRVDENGIADIQPDSLCRAAKLPFQPAGTVRCE